RPWCQPQGRALVLRPPTGRARGLRVEVSADVWRGRSLWIVPTYLVQWSRHVWAGAYPGPIGLGVRQRLDLTESLATASREVTIDAMPVVFPRQRIRVERTRRSGTTDHQ